MRKSPLAFVIALGVVCGSLALPGEAQGQGSASRVERMTSVLSTDHAHFKKPMRELVSDSATFRRHWREMHGAEKVPQIDFRRSVVVLIAIGSRSTTGYEVHVRELRTTGTELHVFVDLIEPGAECPVGAEVQSPATMVEAMVRVSRGSPPKVVFHERRLVRQCSTE